MNVAELETIGRYRVKRFIAEGGMAWVFEVVDPTFETFEVVRALKMLKPEAAAGQEFQRFQAEAALLAGIDHPNLVTIYEFGRDEATGCHFYTMTFIDGPTLAAYRDQQEGLPDDEVLRIFEEVLAGLGELHRRKIVHRDIKPGNVLMGRDGRARLADLGIARVEDNSGRTRTGFALGTVNYMSPEQARGRPVSPASDVFSVGLTLYEALTGRLVYDDVEDLDSTSSHEVLGYLVHLARSGEELDVDFEAAGIPPAIASVLTKACRFDPEERYADASEMLEALRAARRRPAELQARRAPMPRWPWIAAASLAVVVGVAAYLWNAAATEERVEQALAEASALATELDTFVERSVNLEPARPDELTEALRSSRAASQRYLADARADFEAARMEAAETNARRASDALAGICARIVTEYARPLATERLAAARARVEALREEGAGEPFPDEIEALHKMLPAEGAMASIGTGCAGGNASLDQIELAGAIETRASALDAKLVTWLPTVVAEARDRAVGARTRAEGDPVDASPFTTAMAAAAEALSRGDALREEEELRGARAAFQEARERYEAAGAIAPASRARAEALAVERKLEEQGVPPKAETSLILSSAHGHYREQRWKEATAEFHTATARMTRDLDRGAALLQARTIQETAEARRTEAVTAGAERSARQELEQANAAIREGAKALSSEQIEEAMMQFQKAERLFATARDVSARAVEDANEAKRAAERDLEVCADLPGPGAQASCESARDALERGSRSLASLDAPSALEAFAEATRSVQTARTESQTYLDATQVPPSIVSYTPSRGTVEARRNQRLEFSVEATDENDEELRYEWTFEDNRLPDTGSSLSFPPQREGRLQVAVIDSSSGRATRSWLIELLNTPPRVTVTPRGSVELSLGGYRTFRADVEDPDGDAIDLVWKLDGRQVGTGSSYRFQGDAQGEHRLEFVATDTGGERTVAMRQIEVTKAAPPPPPNNPPVVSLTPGSATTELTEGGRQSFEATVRDADGDSVRSTWTLDGKRVASGSSYVFDAGAPGTHRLELSASDGKDTKTVARTIVVKPRPVTPVAPTPPQVAGGDCVSVPGNLQISAEWQRGVATALERYCSAIEAKNMADLRNIFSGLRTDPQQQFRWETRWEGKFASPRGIDLSLAVVSAYTAADDRVSLKLKQTEQRGDRTQTSDHTVTLLKRGGNEWFITEIN